MPGRDAQWHGLEDDPIEDVSFEDLRLEPPRKVSGTGQPAMDEKASTSQPSGSSTAEPSTTSTTTKGKGQGSKSQPKAPAEKAKGVMHRGKAAMQSPQVMNIWASGKEQPLGKAAQRGQAAMMGKTTQYGFVCQPIRSYQQQLRDPEPQDAVPRPTAQTMEDSDSTGSFELVQQDEEAPATTRQCREEGQHQAMETPGGSAASSAAPRDASQEGRNSKRKAEKQQAETK